MGCNIGLYGGAFDPPHLAHVVLAEAAVAQLQLDRMIVVPTGQPPHRAEASASAAHRLAMAQLAFAHMARAEVDPIELNKAAASYTFDTLAALKLRHSDPENQWFVLIGQDQFDRLGSWHRIDELRKIATFCVATRSMNTATSGQNDLKLPSDSTLQGLQWRQLAWQPLAVSATQIRQALAQVGWQSQPRLPPELSHLQPAVLRYIAEHNLYST
jgi:nicotinate-nucleotide adenylyltransferase